MYILAVVRLEKGASCKRQEMRRNTYVVDEKFLFIALKKVCYILKMATA
jgi:hypothetical protein